MAEAVGPSVVVAASGSGGRAPGLPWQRDAATVGGALATVTASGNGFGGHDREWQEGLGRPC